MPKARPASLFVPGLLISALLLAASALRAESNDAILQQHYTAAQTLQHQGKLSQAAAQYRLFIADALGELAIDRARLHQYSQAAPLFDEALALAPRSPALQVEYAQAALIAANSGANQAEAQAQLKLQLAATPKDALAWAALGHLLAVQHRDAPALADLNRAIRLNASSPDTWLYLGELDFNSGHHTQAAAAFRRAIQLTKDPARGRYRIRKAHYLLGRILAAQGHRRQALAQMHIAQQLDQDSLSLDRRRMADFLNAADSAGRTPTAAAHAPDSAHSQPLADPKAVRETNALAQQLADPVADSFDNLGVIAASQKRFSAAAGDFQQAAGWNAALPGLNKNWGRAAFYAGRFSDAIVPLARLVATQPRNQHYRAALGISQYMTGDYAACIRTLQPIKAQLASIPAAQRIYKAALVKIAAKQKTR